MLALKRNPKKTEELMFLEIDQISPNPYQPRTQIDDSSIEELAVSVKKYGVLQPITVRRTRKGYELIAGERRWRAAKLAGLSRIPALVLQVRNDDSAFIALIENVQREDLHYFDEAEAMYALLIEHDITQDELADMLGKTQSTIANKLRLLRLPPSVKARIKQGRLTERHARALLKLPTEELQHEALDKIQADLLTVKDAEAHIEGLLLSSPNTKLTASVNPKSQKKFKLLLRDYKLFFNTIKKTVSDMKNAGVDARYIERETENGYEITLLLPNDKSDGMLAESSAGKH